MKYIMGDLITVANEKYVVIEVLNYENNNYVFANKIFNEDITDEFYILELKEDGTAIIIVEDELKNILMSKFEKILQNDIAELLGE